MAGLRDFPHLPLYILRIPVFELGNIKDIIDLMGSPFNSVPCLKNLALNCHLPQRKSDGHSDMHLAFSQIFLAALDLGAVDRQRLESVQICLFAELFEGRIVRKCFQIGVVDHLCQLLFRDIHKVPPALKPVNDYCRIPFPKSITRILIFAKSFFPGLKNPAEAGLFCRFCKRGRHHFYSWIQLYL